MIAVPSDRAVIFPVAETVATVSSELENVVRSVDELGVMYALRV
jgi:hypothetical protein